MINRATIAALSVVLAGCSASGDPDGGTAQDAGRCEASIFPRQPTLECTAEILGTSICPGSPTVGYFYKCNADGCWDGILDGPCAPVPNVDGGPPSGVVLCAVYRGVAPEVPCTSTNAGDIWCVGRTRFQCLPSPENCWAPNEGPQPCTHTADGG